MNFPSSLTVLLHGNSVFGPFYVQKVSFDPHSHTEVLMENMVNSPKAFEEEYFYLDSKKIVLLMHSKGTSTIIVRTRFYQPASSFSW